jgi:hypothetical protein
VDKDEYKDLYFSSPKSTNDNLSATTTATSNFPFSADRRLSYNNEPHQNTLDQDTKMMMTSNFFVSQTKSQPNFYNMNRRPSQPEKRTPLKNISNTTQGYFPKNINSSIFSKNNSRGDLDFSSYQKCSTPLPKQLENIQEEPLLQQQRENNDLFSFHQFNIGLEPNINAYRSQSGFSSQKNIPSLNKLQQNSEPMNNLDFNSNQRRNTVLCQNNQIKFDCMIPEQKKTPKTSSQGKDSQDFKINIENVYFYS